jgi:hypothetical protein
MYIEEIVNYSILQNNKNQILIDIANKTKNINRITLSAFSINKGNLEVSYFIGNIESLKYVFSNIKEKHVNIIKKKDSIWIRESKKDTYVSINGDIK